MQRNLLRGVMAAVALFAAGFSLPAWAEVKILALGDSLTAGYGLAENEGLVPQLNAWLKTQGSDVTVINGGVSGDTSAGGLSRLAWALEPGADALIVTLGGNDLLRALPPAETRKNITAILTQAQSRGLPVLLIGMKAPSNLGPAYQHDFDALYPELAAQFGTLFIDSYFGLIDPTATDPGAIRSYFQADGLHPNAQGVAKVVQNLGPKVQELAAQVK